MFRYLFLGAALLFPSSTIADVSPYAGQEIRAVKALSDAEINGLLEGQGLELAKAAELNGYPGPRHVLDIAPDLRLTADQINALQPVKERMAVDAKKIGAEIIDQERLLDRMFAEGTIDPARLIMTTAEIGALRASLRAVHLLAHIETRAILTKEQTTRYNMLRGYRESPPEQPNDASSNGHGRHLLTGKP